jgi:acetolactate synthase I/II/III large subunit
VSAGRLARQYLLRYLCPHQLGVVLLTELVNSDVIALARAFCEPIENTQDFPEAFERARASGKPALIALRTDLQQLTLVVRLG